MTHFQNNDLSEKSAPLRILLIEVNIVSQAVISNLILKLGHHVDIFSDGDEALTSGTITTAQYDVILLDLEIDSPTAVEFLLQLNQQAKSPPVIGLYMDNNPALMLKIESLGVTTLLRKPIALPLIKKALLEIKPDKTIQPSNAPPINPDRIFEITNGDKELEEELLSLFLEQAPAIINRLEIAVNKKDWEAVSMEAHTLKGASGNIGANKLSLLSQNLEAGIKDPKQQLNAVTHLQALSDEMKVINTYLESKN
jgi:two-component system, sensor histidine kinase and response regulator